MNPMKKNIRWMIFGAAFLGMGMSMPGCPGQQMQTQMDAMTAANQKLEGKLKGLETQVNQMAADMGQVKQLLPQMTNVIQAQKGAIDQLETSVKELRTKGGKKR